MRFSHKAQQFLLAAYIRKPIKHHPFAPDAVARQCGFNTADVEHLLSELARGELIQISPQLGRAVLTDKGRLLALRLMQKKRLTDPLISTFRKLRNMIRV